MMYFYPFHSRLRKNSENIKGYIMRCFHALTLHYFLDASALRPFRATLAKPEMKAYRKRELRLLRQQKPELARRITAPRTAAKGYIFSQPRPIATMGRGILLSGVSRQ